MHNHFESPSFSFTVNITLYALTQARKLAKHNLRKDNTRWNGLHSPREVKKYCEGTLPHNIDQPSTHISTTHPRLSSKAKKVQDQISNVHVLM